MFQRKPDQKLNPAISLVKVIAMLLIIHSHSDILFPERLSFLATGGALGNELFFLVGGYLYSTKRKLAQTTYRRFVRLYVPTYLMTILLYIFGTISIGSLTSPKEIIYRVIWPTSFWFVSSIFINGILFHALYIRSAFSTQKKTILLAIIFLILNTLIYILFIPNKDVWIVEDYKFFDGMVYYKCIYSFAVFCIGYLIRYLETKKRIAINEKILFSGALISFVVFYVFKLLLNRGIISMRLQLLSQPITVICVVFILLWVLKSTTINKCFNSSWNMTRIVNILGEITLEAFLVQFEIVSAIDKLNIAFPVNYFLNVVIIIIAAYLFHRVDNVICAFLIRTAEQRKSINHA